MNKKGQNIDYIWVDCGATPLLYGKNTPNQGGRSCAVAGGPLPKSLDSPENFEPEHTPFCRELRFVAIYALFLEIFGHKKCLLGKNSASWARSALLHGIYCIFY